MGGSNFEAIDQLSDRDIVNRNIDNQIPSHRNESNNNSSN